MRSHRYPGNPRDDEIGGTYKGTYKKVQALEPAIDPISDEEVDIYPTLPVSTLPKRHSKSHPNNRLRAKQIAEARLNEIAAELLELADELRSLHPDMADSLDDAWNATDTALEILLDEKAW